MTFKKEIKLLTKAYKKKLDALHKENIKNNFITMDYFVTNLQLVRDKLALTNKNTKPELVRLATMTAAIEAYNSYANCITNYFEVQGEEVIQKVDGSEDEAIKAYVAERKLLLAEFCKILNENLLMWEADTDDTIQ